MREIKQAEFFAILGNTEEQTLASLSVAGSSPTDSPDKLVYPSLRSIQLDATLKYNFYGYLWAAYSADLFCYMRAQVRLSHNDVPVAKIQLASAYKQGTGSFAIKIPVTSGFTWGTTQLVGDIGFNPLASAGGSQGEGNTNVITYLHPQSFNVPVNRMDLDIIGWSNVDARYVHAFIAALPQ